MKPLVAFGLWSWIEEHRRAFEPPVGNKVIWEDSQFTAMVVRGPNARRDFHIDPSDEIFYMLKGDMTLEYLEDGRRRTAVIREGEMLLVPALTPHAPHRPAETWGLVIEVKRTSDAERDAGVVLRPVRREAPRGQDARGGHRDRPQARDRAVRREPGAPPMPSMRPRPAGSGAGPPASLMPRRAPASGRGEGSVTPLRVVVVGGGIAGLAAAHRLVELAREAARPLDLVLLEAAGRLGGTIRTERADGFLLEAGAGLLHLREALGARRSRSASASGRGSGGRTIAFAARYVVRRGRLEPPARGVSPPGADPRGAGPDGRASSPGAGSSGSGWTWSCRAGAWRRGREPRELRPAAARTRGARAGGPAPDRRDLHGGPGPPVSRGDHAAIPRPRAASTGA